MNFKYILASCFALVGVVSSVFGFSSISTPSEASSPISVGAPDSSSEKTSASVCANVSNSFNQDESNVLASEYAKSGTAECLFVGCGGII